MKYIATDNGHAGQVLFMQFDGYKQNLLTKNKYL